MKKKTCSKCKQLKSYPDDFHKTSRKKGNYIYYYYHSACKDCRREERKIYIKNNSDKIKKHNQAYYKKNSKVILKRERKNYLKEAQK